MFERLDDTIVAVSTPPGRGQRGVLRLSGPDALVVAGRMFREAGGAATLEQQQHNFRLVGRVAFQDERFLLPAEALVFRRPHSYTREEVVEFHTTAGSAILALLVDRAIELGARQAEAGEFTARAFYHGALSLAAVEGVAALIHARGDQQLRAANEFLDGHLAQQIADLREELADVVALVEADIDFAEEHIEFIRPDELASRVQAVVARLERFLDQSHAIERFVQPPRVALIGPPNVGKSTLMNRLSGMTRAVCSPVQGTTRDLLSAVAKLPGGEVELFDTAGLAQNGKKMDKFAKNFLMRELPRMDLVCYVIDLTRSSIDDQILPEVERFERPIIWVANKVDLLLADELPAVVERHRALVGGAVEVVSAKRGDGVESLRCAIRSALFGNAKPFDSQRLATSARHRRVIAEALLDLQRALSQCRAHDDLQDCAECVASDLRGALGALGTMFGEVTTDELLGRIFEGFCIGK